MLESFSPLDGARLGAVPTVGPQEVESVVDAVAEVQPFWAALPVSDRGRYMRRTAQVIIDDLDELGALITREQGRPRTESYVAELLPAIDALHWIADVGPQFLADESVSVPIFARRKRARFSYEPRGVVGVIAPSSEPWSIPFHEVALALMCGNGVVLKPGALTPLIGERIRAVFERAGVPEGLVRTIHAGEPVPRRLAESTTAARLEAAGGTSPMVVLAEANLANAVSGAVWGGFANAGQSLSTVERVYVMREVADRFVERVVRGAQALRLGDPMAWETEIGPLTSREQLEVVDELVDRAVADGATLHCGGPARVEGFPGAPFYAPAVLTGVSPGMGIMREKAWGPVVRIVSVDSEEEAIRLANDPEPAPAASVWTLDRGRGERIARRLEAGAVWVNDHLPVGTPRSRLGFHKWLNVKLVSWEPSRWRAFWWHPYDESLGAATHAFAQLVYGRDADKPAALRRGVLPLMRVARRSLRDVLKR